MMWLGESAWPECLARVPAVAWPEFLAELQTVAWHKYLTRAPGHSAWPECTLLGQSAGGGSARVLGQLARVPAVAWPECLLSNLSGYRPHLSDPAPTHETCLLQTILLFLLPPIFSLGIVHLDSH